MYVPPLQSLPPTFVPVLPVHQRSFLSVQLCTFTVLISSLASKLLYRGKILCCHRTVRTYGRLNRLDKVRNSLIIICEHRRSEQEHLFGRLFSFSWFFVRSVVYLFFRSFGWSFPVRLVVFIRLFVRSLFARSVASVDNSPSHPRFYKQKSSETTTLGRKPVVIHIQVYILGHNQPI